MLATHPDRALSAGSPALAVLILSLGRVVVGRLVAGPRVLGPVVRRGRAGQEVG